MIKKILSLITCSTILFSIVSVPLLASGSESVVFEPENTIESNVFCTSQGTQVRRCTLCRSITDTMVLLKTFHKFDSWKVIKAVTNHTAGRKTRTCTQCSKLESAI